MKKCPYCAEEIQDDAVKCRYCGETLLNISSTKKPLGFWEDFGQKAKRQLDKFEANEANRNEKISTVINDLKTTAKTKKNQYDANTPARKKKEKEETLLGCLGCFGFIIVVIICWFAFKGFLYGLIDKIFQQ